MNNQNNNLLKTEDVTWNLSDLYKDRYDKTLKQDIAACEKEAGSIKKQYEGRLDSLTPPEFLELVVCLEALEARQGRISTFAYLNFATKTKDPEAASFLQEIREFNSRIGRETVFFELEWNRLDQTKIDTLLSDKLLVRYRHYLQSLRRYAPHQLTATEETLLIERAPVGRSSWTNLFDKLLGHLEFGNRRRSEEEVLTDLYDPDRKVRKEAAADLTSGLKSQLHILTHIFNTILADKMIDDRLRKYDSWVSSMNLYNELNATTVDTLINEVTSRYDIVQRYYCLKKDVLGLPKLADYDRYAPLPHLPADKVDWLEGKQMVLESFGEFSAEMRDIAAMFYDRNWIHAPIIEGKRGGAFAHPCIPEIHPYVMVNYSGNLRDVSTVAHELGHGVHQFLASAQGYYNSDTTLVLAETASVFGELLLFKGQVATLKDIKQKKAFICQKLESIFATVFRQVAMNRFEDLIHNSRREKGELSAADLSDLWLQSQRQMFGDSVNLSEDYGVWWSYIPHFLSTPGYVYSYAFGELLVLALYNLYQQDQTSFVPLYLDLLKSGGIDTPYRLLEPFGINLDDPAFWQGGLAIIDEMLTSVENLD